MYRKILVPLDGSEMAECVLPHVEEIAKRCQAEVVLFQVCQPAVILADYPADLREGWEDHVKRETTHLQQICATYLGEAEKKFREAGLNTTVRTGSGNAAEQILDYATQNQVDLIILATHGRSGITRWAYGSTTDKVLHASPIPVMIIRPCKK